MGVNYWQNPKPRHGIKEVNEVNEVNEVKVVNEVAPSWRHAVAFNPFS